MAFSQSGLFTDTFKDVLEGTTTIDLNGSSLKIALYDNTITLSAATNYDAANPGYGSAPFASGEVTGTGWSAGGVALASPGITVADPAAGQLSFDATDVSESGTTLSDIYGCMIYDDSSTGATDAAIVAVAFSGAPYSTTAGTLTITWDADGIFYLDLVP